MAEVVRAGGWMLDSWRNWRLQTQWYIARRGRRVSRRRVPARRGLAAWRDDGERDEMVTGGWAAWRQAVARHAERDRGGIDRITGMIVAADQRACFSGVRD